VTYFSGFCLEGESELFSDWLVPGDFAVAGFSLGAIRAFEFALGSESRIDRLLLFSPAFFQSRPERYLRLQLEAYARDPEGYRRTFLARCAAPSGRDLSPYAVEGSPEELEFLLRYRWEEEKLRALRDRGVVIEVFVGEKDRILEAQKVIDFFAPRVDALYRFRQGGHILLS